MPSRTPFLITILFLSLTETAWAVSLDNIPEVTSLETAAETRDERLYRAVIAKACSGDLPLELFKNEESAMEMVLAKLEAGVRFEKMRAVGTIVQCPNQWNEQTFLRQIRDMFSNSHRISYVGTDTSDPFFNRAGDYDFALRGLVRLIYQYGDFLLRNKDEGQALYEDIFTRFVKPYGGPRLPDQCVYYVNCSGGVSPSLPETENHILGTQTSIYLINQLLLKSDRNNQTWDNRTNGMKALMLERLQHFVQYDFEEYNSRPYARHSLLSIENLHDFAEDPEVQLAARLVLDYISAKFAVSNSYLRRVVPFRRQARRMNDSLLFDQNSDEVTGLFLLRSGLAQRVPKRDTGWWYDGSMLLAGIGGYQVPDLIQDLIVNQAHRNLYQRIHHDGVEIYAGSDKYLISAGGIPTDVMNILRIELLATTKWRDDNDRGVALATTLIPAASPVVDWHDFIRFEGYPSQREMFITGHNTCVAPNFACGWNPVIPQRYLQYLHEGDVHTESKKWKWTFINASSEGFYVAVYSRPADPKAELSIWEKCAAFIEDTNSRWTQNPDHDFDSSNNAESTKHFCLRDAMPYGFFEVIESNKLPFGEFKNRVLEKNDRLFFGRGVYETVTGERIEFNVPQVPSKKYEWPILKINEQVFDSDITHWPLAEGTIINSRGKTGYVEIRNPALDQTLILDFTDVNNPRRVLLDTARALPARGEVKALRARPGHIDLFTMRQDGAVYSTWWEATPGWAPSWFPISTSSLYLDPSSEVTALRQSSWNALNLFAVGKDGGVYETYWPKGTPQGPTWDAWDRIGPVNLTAKGTPVTALEARLGRIELFVVGQDGGIYTTFFGAHPVEAAFNNPFAQRADPRLHLPFIQGRGVEEPGMEEGGIEERGVLGQSQGRIPPGGPTVQIPATPVAPPCTTGHLPCWGSWMRIGDQVAAPGSVVTAIVPSPGHIDLFIVAPDGSIYSTFSDARGWFEESPGRKKWFAIGTGKASLFTQVTAISSDGRIDLFIVGQDGGIYTTNWAKKNWQDWEWDTDKTPGWTRIGTLTVPFHSQIAAVIPRNSHLDLFVVGPEGQVYSTYREFFPRKEFWPGSNWPASNWVTWFAIGKAGIATKASQVVSLVPRDGHIDLFALAGDGAIYSTWWEPQPGWQNWFRINSRLDAPAPLNIVAKLDQPEQGPSPVLNRPQSVFGIPQWTLQPGLAKDIGGNANGVVWAIGTGPVGTGGDYGIFRWTGSGWQAVDGGGVRIDVGPDGNPWIVNARGQVFQRVNNQWQPRPGLAKDIGIGADGSVWIIGAGPVGTGGDYGIFRWTGAGWQAIDGGGVRIDVDPSGNPWVVNVKGEIWQRLPTGWKQLPGLAKDIGIGGDGSVWVIGTGPVGTGGDFGIFRWTGSGWQQIDGAAVQITIGKAEAWVVNSSGEIFSRPQP